MKEIPEDAIAIPADWFGVPAYSDVDSVGLVVCVGHSRESRLRYQNRCLLPAFARDAEFAADGVAVALHAAGLAGAAPVEDEEVREEAPGIPWEELHEALLDFGDAGVRGREGEAACEALDVGVDNNAVVDVEAVAEDDVGGLAGDAAEGEELLHGARNLAAEAIADRGHGFVDGAGLVAEEADRFDVGLDLLGRSGGVRGGRGESGEERGRDLVHADIGRLGREDRGDEKLVRIRKGELAVRVGVLGAERGQQTQRAELFGR